MSNSNKKNTLIAIDPGTNIWGYAITDGRKNLIKSNFMRVRSKCPHHKLILIYEQLSEIIYHFEPYHMAIETACVGVNKKTALIQGQSRAIFLFTAYQAGLGISQYTPTEIKKAITGKGRADKQEVAMCAEKFFKIDFPILNDNESDAIAIAATHFLKQN